MVVKTETVTVFVRVMRTRLSGGVLGDVRVFRGDRPDGFSCSDGWVLFAEVPVQEWPEIGETEG